MEEESRPATMIEFCGWCRNGAHASGVQTNQKAGSSPPLNEKQSGTPRRAYLKFVCENGGLAPTDNLERREAVVADDLKVSIGSLGEFFRRMGFESE